jgi:glycogen operon protein
VLRNRQVKNFPTVTILAGGAMILMGDEVRHTQHGNNKRLPSGQRNQLVRLDAKLAKHADVHRFVLHQNTTLTAPGKTSAGA